MKTHFLFPNKFKKFGWICLILGIILELLITNNNWEVDSYFNTTVFAFFQNTIGNNSSFFSIIENSILDEIITFMIIIGGILVSFSKLKNEDEYISQIRYESLVWATYVNYILILLITALVYGFTYFAILYYNIYSLLLFFIVRFHYMIYKLNKSSNDDE